MKPIKVLNNIFTYCDKATIGVLKYISRRTLSNFERTFWTLCIIFSLVACVILVKDAIEKFLDHKFAFKISDKRSAVSEVPFPAFAICPELLISENDLEKLNLKAFEQLQ